MKKVLSLITALCFVFSMLCIGMSAFAKDAVNVNFSLVYAGVYAVEPASIAVSADISDKYADVVGYNDTLDEPTILDAVIAAHIYLWGEETPSLKCSSSGWISSAFGETTTATSYRQNGASAWSLNTALAENDYIDFAFYQDVISYQDAYTCFDKREVTVHEGDSVMLTSMSEGYDASWNVVKLPTSNVNVTVNGEVAGKTDADGAVTLTFDKAGTYSVTTTGDFNGTPIFPPFCRVNVLEKGTTTEPTTEPVTQPEETDKPTTTQPEKKPSQPTTVPETETTVEPITDVTNKPIASKPVSAVSANTVESQMIGAANYLSPDGSSYDVSQAMDYLMLIKSGKDMSATEDAFLKSVADNLKANNGKIVVYGSESIGAYGAVIQILDYLGEDASDFEGFDIVSALGKMNVKIPADNPYYYRTAIEATLLYDFDDEFVKTLCQSLIDNFYTMGKGMNYYGYSCDNTAHFITSLAPYAEDYAGVIADALKVIETYKTQGGYGYNYEYNEANCNSTAAALMAYSSLGEFDKANEIYKELCAFESKDTGVFTYGGEANALATKDALTALEYYYDILPSETDASQIKEETIKPETSIEESTTAKTAASVKENKSKKSPSTGAGAETAVIASLAAAAVITAVAKRKIK